MNNETTPQETKVQVTAEALKDFLTQRFDSNMKLGVMPGDGFDILFGPFPSFLIHVKGEELTMSIDVTADAPTMAAMTLDLAKNFPNLQYGGCFVFDPEDMSKMVLDPVQCYDMKLVHMKRMIVSHIAAQAVQKATEPQIALPESKIILNPKG